MKKKALKARVIKLEAEVQILKWALSDKISGVTDFVNVAATAVPNDFVHPWPGSSTRWSVFSSGGPQQ